MLTVFSVQYHTVLVQLFIPLLQDHIFTGEAKTTLHRMVAHHARSGLEPLQHIRRCYGTRFLSPCIIFCLVHLCDTLFKYSPEAPPVDHTIEFCLDALDQANAGFPLCGPLQALFCGELENNGLGLPDPLRQKYKGINEKYTLDEVLDACTRYQYIQPVEAILRFFDPAVARDWNSEWEAQVVKRRRAAIPGIPDASGHTMQISSLLNT